jgi:uracil phosphoribosyltransferase
VYSSGVPVHVVDHPIGQHALLQLRNASTPPSRFRRLAARLSVILALEATRDLPTVRAAVETPLEETMGARLSSGVTLVPVLRAGLAMLDPILDLLPAATVGHIGLERNELTALASRYYMKLPPIGSSATVLMLDPMLATGGSAVTAIRLLQEAGARTLRLLCVVAAPEGLAAVEQACPGLPVYTAAVDRELNAQKYILPGLGDFGDRLYGT